MTARRPRSRHWVRQWSAPGDGEDGGAPPDRVRCVAARPIDSGARRPREERLSLTTPATALSCQGRQRAASRGHWRRCCRWVDESLVGPGSHEPGVLDGCRRARRKATGDAGESPQTLRVGPAGVVTCDASHRSAMAASTASAGSRHTRAGRAHVLPEHDRSAPPAPRALGTPSSPSLRRTRLRLPRADAVEAVAVVGLLPERTVSCAHRRRAGWREFSPDAGPLWHDAPATAPAHCRTSVTGAADHPSQDGGGFIGATRTKPVAPRRSWPTDEGLAGGGSGQVLVGSAPEGQFSVVKRGGHWPGDHVEGGQARAG